MFYQWKTPWKLKVFHHGMNCSPSQSIQPFKRQPYKVVKHTQTIRRLLPTNCLSVLDHSV